MTREEAKELLPVIKAYAEGKVIQRYRYDSKDWYDVPSYVKLEFLDKPEHLRVKPEPTYRPFKDGEECWQEMQKHQPFGWVKEKERNICTLITYLHTEGIETFHSGSTNFKAIFNAFTFVDGIPFGITENNPNT